MTITVPQVVIDAGPINTTLDNTNFPQQIATLSDGPFVVVFNSNGTVRLQQMDQFGNRIDADGVLASSGPGADDAIDFRAVEGNGLVLAYRTKNGGDDINIQLFDASAAPVQRNQPHDPRRRHRWRRDSGFPDRAL